MSSSHAVARADVVKGAALAVARDLSASPVRPVASERSGECHPAAQTAEGIDYRVTPDVRMVHAAARRERDEPVAGREPLSLWLVALYGFALFGGAFYMGRYSGDFRGDSLDPAVGQQLAIRSGVAKSASENKVGGHSVDERPNSSAAGQAALVTVLIRNMQYSPALLEVKKGDVVEWKNDDLTPHTVTSPAFDSGSIEPEKSWRHTFTDDGDFPYACTFHPDMKARVVAK